MLEQPRFLEHISDPPVVRRHEDPSVGVDQHLPGDDDPPTRGADESGNDIDHGRLSGARRTEKRQKVTVALEHDIERERAQAMADGDVEAHAPWTRRAMRRPRNSAASSANTD